MSNILISGGAGFIGSHTADALVAQGHRVRVLDVLAPQIHAESDDFPSYMNPCVERLRGDVCDSATLATALQDIDAVYHFAAETGVGQSMYDMRSYVHTNCTGTAAMLEAIVKLPHPIKRFVLASSRAVYGEGTHVCPDHGTIYPPVRRRKDMEQGMFAVQCPVCGKEAAAVPTEEDRPLNPISVYGWTKKHQEDYCQYAAATFGLPVTTLRYFNVYGSRQSLKNPYTGVATIFYNRIMTGQPISLYEHGTPLRDFVHVSDVVQANVLALEADIEPGNCINVGYGERYSITEIAKTLAQACGREVNFEDRSEFRVG
ncbi:MAG: NAD-dependent epimerase/dehydratase family protein, partial [Nitrosospira sp.]